MEEKLGISRREFQELKEELVILRESLELFSNKEKLKEISSAIERIEAGEYLTKEELFQNV